MKRLIIAASILFSVSANAAFSDLAVMRAENDIRNRLEYMLNVDTVEAYSALAKLKTGLDKEVKSGVRANKSCLVIQRDFLKEENSLIEADYAAGIFNAAGVSVKELKALNAAMAEYVGARCMQVK